MKVSDAGINLIARFEGFRARPYRDVAGIWTIGYGETRPDVVKRGYISEPDARRLMRERVDRDFAPAVERALKHRPTQNQFDAMVSLAYNIGTGGFGGSTVVREFNQGHTRRAGLAFMMWVKAGGRTVAGLVNRRRAEMALFFRGSSGRVRYAPKERYLLRLLRSPRVSASRKRRARDWLTRQQRAIARKARAKSGGWGQYDRSRRFQGIRRALGIKD